ncbi:TetR/AcrR family transcriptional regulator [Flavobacteriaceae bacterium F08102]|nr:TetR/AcrR family transcriptional regulator [Flavobacteriaceae bacterium F08102]
MKPENRKNEIIETAARLFKEKGYSAVTMRDLAKAMGIKASSLYNHISSKQDLLSAIIISLAEEFTAKMESILNSPSSNIDKLKKIVSIHVCISSEHSNGMASLNNDWMHLEHQLPYYLKLRSEYEENFRRIILAGIDSCEIKNENSEVILFSMLSTLRSLYLWIPNKEDVNTESLTKSLSEVLINGIAK